MSGLSRYSDPQTSKDAATLLQSRSTDSELVYEFIVRQGSHGATDNEIQIATGLPANSQPTRRNQLVRMRLVRATVRRRATVSGRQAIVWVASFSEELFA